MDGELWLPAPSTRWSVGLKCPLISGADIGADIVSLPRHVRLVHKSGRRRSAAAAARKRRDRLRQAALKALARQGSREELQFAIGGRRNPACTSSDGCTNIAKD